MTRLVAGLVGNPNCGKTTLFNALTGACQQVGNWPGVTVEKKTGIFRLNGGECHLVDLPGVYSLGASVRSSQDEVIARDYVLSGAADLMVNIVDAAHLERNLYLTMQLLEMGTPLVLALNMMDVARDLGIAVDCAALARRLGCPVVPLVATRGRGLDDLRRQIAARPGPSPVRPSFHPAVEQALDQLAASVVPALPLAAGNARWLATTLLEGQARDGADGAAVADAAARVEAACGEEADIVVADGRFAFVSDVVDACVRRTREASRTLSDRIDRVVLDRVLGIPLFLAVMYLMFMFTINVGGAFVDAFDQIAAALLVDGLAQAMEAAGLPAWLTLVVAQGAGGGIRTVVSFVPIIGALFLFLSFLEDSGYMPRAAFVMDRAMRAIGLPGKSFVPLIVGFGCNVPAIMATRTLESHHDRVLTIMMAPFMSCGARLSVYALFAAAFFPVGGQNVVFLLYLIGLAFAVGTGLLLKHSLLPGGPSPFVMELPPYHLPTVVTVFRRARHRLADFVFRAGRVIVPMVMVLGILDSLGIDGSFGNQDNGRSVLALAGRATVPVFEPMGIREDNWPAAVGIFTGIFAKETVVGTLNNLYRQVGAVDGAAAPAAVPAIPTLGEKVRAAAAGIPDRLGKLVETLGDPLGMDVSYTADREQAGQRLAVADGAFAAMTSRFDGSAGAFAYLLLILLYMPCAAATGAINQEIGWRWTVFSVGWTTALGYCSAVIFYQATLLPSAPLAASARIAAAVSALALAALAMRVAGRRSLRRLEWVPAE